MKCQVAFIISFIMLALGLLIGGCSSDDNGTPAGNTFSISIDSTTFVFGEACFAANIAFNGELNETDFFKVVNDTVRSLGWQNPGEPPHYQPANFLPQDITVGTGWWAWNSGPVWYNVESILNIHVPAGTFPSYICAYYDSVTSAYKGYMAIADDIGAISWSQIDDGDTTTMSLHSYSIVSGAGAYPLAVGNEWVFEEGGYTEE